MQQSIVYCKSIYVPRLVQRSVATSSTADKVSWHDHHIEFLATTSMKSSSGTRINSKTQPPLPSLPPSSLQRTKPDPTSTPPAALQTQRTRLPPHSHPPLDPSSKDTTSSSSPGTAALWKTGIVVFDNNKLKEMVETLGRRHPDATFLRLNLQGLMRSVIGDVSLGGEYMRG